MSIFAPGSSQIKSVHVPGAFLEAAIALNKAEIVRNAANPSVTAKNNASIVFNLESGTADISITLPVVSSVTGAGTVQYAPSDYLGIAYSSFTPGGDVTAVTCQTAVAEIGQILSSLEKAVLPLEDQPNNIQIDASSETGNMTITAKLPVTFSIATTGAISFLSTDYL
jgi:hypothetical protein